MTFDEILAGVTEALQREGRISYRALQRRFGMDDGLLDDIKVELIEAKRIARDEDGRILVRADAAAAAPAERRQLTVLFCDLADSTRLARELDPEDLRALVRSYQSNCVAVVQRYGGHVAQYLGDGVLVYFGYPSAHEDDAQRAVRAGLGILQALQDRAQPPARARLAVRIGIHTGLVVVGEMGSGGRHEILAVGETPNVAARLQGLAQPGTLVISEATARLAQGYFEWRDLGMHAVKGLEARVRVLQVLGEGWARSRLDAAEAGGLTPLVGREEELALLHARWATSCEGRGQVVLLAGEPGIGKSRLVRVLMEQAAVAPARQAALRCSPYHAGSALYPVIDYLQRLLQWDRAASVEARLDALERALQAAGQPLAEAVPLMAALLSLPLPARYQAPAMSAQRQKQLTLQTLVAWMLADAAQQPLLALWEDLHWADPSTLELVDLLVESVRSAHMLLVLTSRPEFQPALPAHDGVARLLLGRLGKEEIAELAARVTRGRPLPPAVLQQVSEKTDGIPLFVEELVKAIVESGLVREEGAGYVTQGQLSALAIPATLQDALMARLDRLGDAKALAQLAAVLGREFSYPLLCAIAGGDAPALARGLAQLVEAELLRERNGAWQFKHALVQEVAYASLLRSTRQQHHRRIAQVLEAQFPQAAAGQPELVARHYTEAGLPDLAVHHWLRASQLASDRSAALEAISHAHAGLALLAGLPQTAERMRQSLRLHTALGAALLVTRGHAAPEVEAAYTRAHALCRQLGESPELAPVLFGLWRFYQVRAQFHPALELGESLLRMARGADDAALRVVAHYALGFTRGSLGQLAAARAHFEEGIAHYDAGQRRSPLLRSGQDPGVACRAYLGWILWLVGQPDAAMARAQEALALAHALGHPFSIAFAHCWVATVAQLRRDVQRAHAHAQAAIALATQQDFPLWVAHATPIRGWALAMQGLHDEGAAQVREGIAAWKGTGAALLLPYFCGLLADVHVHCARPAEGLAVLAEAESVMHQHAERWCEAELCRLRGVAKLREPQEAGALFERALDVARAQQAKSLELRAAVSLARLWMQQGRRKDARALLAPVCAGFSEGLHTADLQDAGALLQQAGLEPLAGD